MSRHSSVQNASLLPATSASGKFYILHLSACLLNGPVMEELVSLCHHVQIPYKTRRSRHPAVFRCHVTTLQVSAAMAFLPTLYGLRDEVIDLAAIQA
jgi:hypothetical protein